MRWKLLSFYIVQRHQGVTWASQSHPHDIQLYGYRLVEPFTIQNVRISYGGIDFSANQSILTRQLELKSSCRRKNALKCSLIDEAFICSKLMRQGIQNILGVFQTSFQTRSLNHALLWDLREQSFQFSNLNYPSSESQFQFCR